MIIELHWMLMINKCKSIFNYLLTISLDLIIIKMYKGNSINGK